ncbi:MAG TPA: hypothetical protein PLF71_02435 [bacterium]|nr:MAG: hypothetical protein BWY14_00670 [Parcubacteria group bacterium ADurb.Bin192]HPN14950.1 hypothetical protein [bacterium]
MKIQPWAMEAVGWYGTVVIVGAFALVSLELLAPTSLWYLILNLTGSLGIVFISFKKKAFQPGVLNAIWALITGAAILKLMI